MVITSYMLLQTYVSMSTSFRYFAVVELSIKFF